MGATEAEIAERGPEAFIDHLELLKRECGVDGLRMSDWGITEDELKGWFAVCEKIRSNLEQHQCNMCREGQK